MDSPRTPEPRTTTSGFLGDEEGMLMERGFSRVIEGRFQVLFLDFDVVLLPAMRGLDLSKRPGEITQTQDMQHIYTYPSTSLSTFAVTRLSPLDPNPTIAEAKGNSTKSAHSWPIYQSKPFKPENEHHPGWSHPSWTPFNGLEWPESGASISNRVT